MIFNSLLPFVFNIGFSEINFSPRKMLSILLRPLLQAN
jgi:hypothetical protein